MTPLSTYVRVKVLMRQAQEAILKHEGLSWMKLDELENQIIDEIPSEGLRDNGYLFLVEETENHLDKILDRKDDKEIVERSKAGVTRRISMHTSNRRS